MEKKWKLETTSMSLHLMAMAIMLCDHCKRLFPDAIWLPCVGRLAFPIFAFLIVEGYHRTKNLGKYAKRLLLFAFLSEIPFDLMVGGTAFYFTHQNVLWTFLVGLGLIHINEKVKIAGKLPLRLLVAAGTVIVGYYAGKFTGVDYAQAGVLTVLMFYYFRERTWRNFLLQLVSLVYLNFVMLGSYPLALSLFGHTFSMPRQGLAVLALIPIWLYRGRQGYRSKLLQYCNYAFYPAHMIVIAVITDAASLWTLLVFLIPPLGALIWRCMGETGKTAVRLKLEELEGPAIALAAILGVAMLLIVAPFLSLLDSSVDTVTIEYIENLQDMRRGAYTCAVTRKDEDVIEDWLAFSEIAAPKEERHLANGWSEPFPAYVAEFRRGRTLISQLWITRRETIVMDRKGTAMYVGYIPLNPYYQQAADMMAELQK